MLCHFECIINSSGLRKGAKAWDHKAFHIRYDLQNVFVSQADLSYESYLDALLMMSWLINLATQALLAAHSSSKHYDPAKPTDHEPNIDDFLRDKIGLLNTGDYCESKCFSLSFCVLYH